MTYFTFPLWKCLNRYGMLFTDIKNRLMFYDRMKEDMVGMGVEQAEVVAVIAASQIDGNLVKELQPGDEETEIYVMQRSALQTIKETKLWIIAIVCGGLLLALFILNIAVSRIMKTLGIVNQKIYDLVHNEGDLIQRPGAGSAEISGDGTDCQRENREIKVSSGNQCPDGKHFEYYETDKSVGTECEY